MVGVNVGVAAPMAFFPFAGLEELIFRGLCMRTEKMRWVLYGTESDHEPVVLGLRAAGRKLTQ